MKNKQLIPIVMFILAMVFVTGYILLFQNKPNLNPNTTNGEQSPASKVSPKATNDDILRAGGSSFLDPKGVFNVLYPSDYKIDSQNEGQFTRIYKTGPTQKGQTEIYDGIIVVFESINLNNKSLSSWVDESIKSQTSDGTSEIVQAKAETTINGYPGFTYSMRGLGVAEYLVIQKDKNSDYAVSVTSSVSDPQNIGFQSELDSIISTMQLLK